MTAGVYYLFYHQAERAIKLSEERTTRKAAELTTIDETFFSSGAVMPSVIFRVTDEAGKVILDSNPRVWANEQRLSQVRKDPPFWANREFTLIETANSFFYYREMPLQIGGRTYHFHFLRTITFEKKFIRYLLLTLFAISIVGLSLAIWAGHVMGRKILSPLRNVTETAREISVGNLSRRLTVEEAGDEVHELSVTFNKMLNRLEETFTQQQKFIADASHELRTPITVIRGYVELIESYGADDAELLAESTAAIKNSAQNMQYLVENLLFFARADQGTQPIEKVPIELSDVLEAAVNSFNSPRIKLNCDATFTTTGDAGLLGKMFAAIIDNALAFSTGEVTVSAKIAKDAATVEISDRGMGIAAENIDRIYDRFYKVDAARTNHDDEKISAGLGLSVAKFVADAHGISISVNSELGRGTVFVLTISR